MYSGIHEAVVTENDDYIPPFFLAAGIIHVGQGGARAKRILPDGGYAVTDGHRLEGFAIKKRILPDGGDAVGNLVCTGNVRVK